MEHSRGAHLGLAGALVLLEIVGRLALPAALLALSRGLADVAVVASLASAGATAARGVLLGRATERAVLRRWRETLDAARRMPAARLRAEEHGEVAALTAAVRDVATHDADAVPQVVALTASLLALTVAVAVLLGGEWLGFGAASVVFLGGVTALVQRRLRGAYDRAWVAFEGAASDLGVLIEAAAELRAHGREASFSATLLDRVRVMGREERGAAAWEAVTSLLPASIAVVAVAAPLRAGVGWVVTALGSGTRLAEVAILGGAALGVSIALGRVREQRARVAPLRARLEAFLAEGRAVTPGPEGGSIPPPPSLAEAEIVFERVSYRHPGAARETPRAFDHRWADRRGLAVLGANGAGKSTLALGLLALLSPSRGRVTVGGVDLASLDLAAYRSRLAFVAQGAYVAPGESVAWHLRLYRPAAGADLDDDQLDRALADVGLLTILEERAARSRIAPRDVLAGELSGGERQRLHLARALVHGAELIVLDEPEAALDEAGRRRLRGLLEELTRRAKVLVIAHDPSVVPDSFARVECLPTNPSSSNVQSSGEAKPAC